MHQLLLSCWLVLTVISASAQQIAFERGETIWLMGADGSQPHQIAAGQSPCLSPDGTRLAFNTVQADGQPAHRQIAVLALATGKSQTFEKVPSENAMQPKWSPDGQELLFYLYVKQEMQIGFIRADGTGFRQMPHPEAKPRSYWSVTWGPGGKSVFGQDMESLYQLGLDGTVIKQWRIEKLIHGGGMSGEVRLQLSPEGQRLLMDVEMNEETKRKNWDGPLPAIWLLNLATDKARRVTPKTLFAWDCQWLMGEAICFSSQGAGENGPSVHRMSLDGKNRQMLAKNGRLPSVASKAP